MALGKSCGTYACALSGLWFAWHCFASENTVLAVYDDHALGDILHVLYTFILLVTADETLKVWSLHLCHYLEKVALLIVGLFHYCKMKEGGILSPTTPPVLHGFFFVQVPE